MQRVSPTTGGARVLPFPATPGTTAAAESSAGDAFGAFYAATARPLWGYLRAACGDPTVAEDLLQESYLRLLSVDLDHEGESGRRAYLYRIASNLLRDYWRRSRRRPEAEPLDDEAFAAVGAASPAGQGLDIRRALARLHPRDRQLLWLAHVEGSSHREVAAILGLATASVRVLLFRARRRLAAALEPAPEGRR
jgi:RNA polymerase sigma-70 factor (ECF subfamily)